MVSIKDEHTNINKQIKNDKRNTIEIKELHLSTLDTIQDEIDAFYGKYSTFEGISMQEARQKSNKADVSKLKSKIKRYNKQDKLSNRAKDEIRLYNLNRNVTRLEVLKSSINAELVRMTNEEQVMIEKILRDQTEDEFLRQATILGVSLLIGGVWIKQEPAEAFENGKPKSKYKGKIPHISYTKKTLQEIIDKRMYNAVWSDNLWTNHSALRREVETILERGILAGTGPREMARELRKKIDSSIYNSERLMRTESGFVQIDSQRESYKQTGFDEYIVIAQPTGACNICLSFDGKVYKVEDMEQGENAPIFHPNCRCSTASYMDREKWEQEMRDLGYYTADEIKEMENA